MANQRNQNQRRSSRDPRRSSSQSNRRRSNSRRRPAKRSGFDLSRLIASLAPKAEFKPDTQESGLLKMLHLTQVQRDKLLKWGLYIALVVVLSMIQDVIMSQITIFGATTDLAVCAILLITVIEGIDSGSLFVLIASCLFYFSGSSPGPMSVGLMTVLGIGACLFRQMYWHRNRGSIVLCAGLALMLYELGNFVVGISTGLTRWDRMGMFITTGLLSIAVMIPLYSLINRIGQIGGNTWKE
ncbi:MAG: hypothetical protein IKY96_06180 [Oscillospiraceae bacterium]|nr:hypothetical protein [Oscillospiraceae bacterium]